MNMDEAETNKLNKETIAPGTFKAREYADRIIDSEAYESIIQGLGPVMITAINEALERRGYDFGDFLSRTVTNELEEIEVTRADILVNYVMEMTRDRNSAVQKLYADLLANKSDPEKRALLTKALIGDTYRGLRISDYERNANEEVVWSEAQLNQTVPVKEQNDWMYRGYFGKNGEETITRGSFNVHVTTELITALDEYIASDAVKANYKFGAPNTPASPVERHDAISIYFLEEPSEKVLNDLTQIIKPYIRGDSLLGKKIADGFYLSEIGSIQDEHIEKLIEILDTIDPPFAKGLKIEMTHKGRLAMSEAQFYAMQKTAKVFGYKIDYHPTDGFTVELSK
jgi:hypothetical protein